MRDKKILDGNMVVSLKSFKFLDSNPFLWKLLLNKSHVSGVTMKKLIVLCALEILTIKRLWREGVRRLKKKRSAASVYEPGWSKILLKLNKPRKGDQK